MINHSIIKQYLRAGKILMPLIGKLPKEKNWQNKQYNEDLYNYPGNLGWVLSNQDLIIDIDPRNGGEESWKKFKELLNLDLEFSVTTARKGHHIYLSIPKEFDNYSFRKTLKEFPGIDFLTKGSYCLISGCSTEHGNYNWSDDNFLECFEQFEAPSQLIHFISKEKKESDLGDFEGLIGSSSNWDEEKVVEMLYKLDPSVEYDTWIKIGMALHEWDPIRGIELWEEWSKGGENYEEGVIEKVSRGFNIGGGVTLGTVSYMAREVDIENNIEEINKLIEKIKLSSEKDFDLEIYPKLKKMSLGKLDVEKLAKAIQERIKELLKVKLPIGEIRGNIVGLGELVEKSERPEWCNDWVYVNSHTAYVNKKSLRVCKAEAFNLANGDKVPMGQGGRQSASKYVSENCFVDIVDTMNYLPSISDRICKMNGLEILNIFDENSVPVEASEYSKEGLEAIERVKRHIKFICSSKENSQILTEWIAHNIQFPGKQILWSPIIQGIQGVGKSFFGELFRMCLGDKNIGVVSPNQVVSDFNGWANNHLVNVLEELRVKGHNRHDAVNSLKPLITDRVIQINTKGVNQYKAINTTNYICFTNFKDSIPMDADDRRWWVIFCPLEKLSDLNKYVGEDAATYFPSLFDAIRENGQEIRKWFLEMKISSRFMNSKQAPITDYKLGMVATEEAGFEGLNEIKDLIEKGGDYFNKDVICSNDLFNALMFEDSEIELNRSQRGAILKRLGYMSLPDPVKYGGKTRRFWAKRKMTNEEIRSSFKKEIDENDLSFLD